MSRTSPQGELADRVQASPWARSLFGLPQEVARWEGELGRTRPGAGIDHRRLTHLGVVPPGRAARRWAAFSSAPLSWVVRRLPADVAAGRPLDDPAAWVQQTTAAVVRDELARLGPVASEVAGVLADAGGLLPGPLADELRSRPVTTPPLPPGDVERIARRALPGRLGEIDEPLTVGAVSQLHPAALRDGSPVLLRVCRPGAAAEVRGDARMATALLLPLERTVPLLGALNPLGLVEVLGHLLLEGADARNEALNAVELGLLVEDLAVEGVTVPRPLPDLVTGTVAAFEPLDGTLSSVPAPPAPPSAASLVRLCAEAALARGRFHGDLRPGHAVATPDGRLALVGCRSVGHLDLTTRRGLLDTLAGILTADEGLLAAGLEELGAAAGSSDTASQDAKRDAADAAADLLAAVPSGPVSLLAPGGGGMRSLAAAAVQVLLRHRIRLPLEVVLLARALLGLRPTVAVADAGDGSLLPAALPLVARLPALRAALG